MQPTRELTVEEAQNLVRQLSMALGGPTAAMTALRVIGEAGVGIFVVAP
jgi:hypothetical protein